MLYGLELVIDIYETLWLYGSFCCVVYQRNEDVEELLLPNYAFLF